MYFFPRNLEIVILVTSKWQYAIWYMKTKALFFVNIFCFVTLQSLEYPILSYLSVRLQLVHT